MEMKVERQEFNPWDVVSIFDFTYYLYCCPECDWKEPSKQEFVNHALTYHPWVSFILVQSLTIAFVFELIYYINGYF